RQLFAFTSGRAAFEFVGRQNFDVREQRIRRDDIERGLKFVGDFVVSGEEGKNSDETKRNDQSWRFHASSVAALCERRKIPVVAGVSPAVPRQCSRDGCLHRRTRNYLLSWEGPAGAFFMSSPFTPIFIKNGS